VVNNAPYPLNDKVQFDVVINVVGVQRFEVQNHFFDKYLLLITFGENCEFRRLNDFFNNENFDGEGSMIRRKSIFREDAVTVKFRRATT